jgi:hypothetical protein
LTVTDSQIMIHIRQRYRWLQKLDHSRREVEGQVKSCYEDLGERYYLILGNVFHWDAWEQRRDVEFRQIFQYEPRFFLL